MFLDISGEICSSVWLERSGRPVKHLTLYFRPLAGTANLVPFNSTVFLPKMQNVTRWTTHTHVRSSRSGEWVAAFSTLRAMMHSCSSFASRSSSGLPRQASRRAFFLCCPDRPWRHLHHRPSLVLCMAEQDRVGGALSAVAFVRRVGDIIEVLSLLQKNSALPNASLEVRRSNRS